MKGLIFDVKEMAVHDGPGIRTTVFFKGCPLRCKWCHNPEGLTYAPELSFNQNLCRGCGACTVRCSHPDCAPFGRCLHVCPENALTKVGEWVEAKALAKRLVEGANVLGSSFGGFTFSGGEPLMQSDFLLSLTEELHGYHLCIESSGYCDEETFRKVVSRLDMVIMDIKLADRELHLKYTGVSNERILNNLKYLQECGVEHVIRTPLIPRVTDTHDNLSKTAALVGASTWEKLPYNPLAGAKYKSFGMTYPLDSL